MPTIIITAGTQLTLPVGWNPLNNSIEVIGGGGGGARRTSSAGGTGGNGGGYAKVVNFGTAGQSLTISIGSGGAAGTTTTPTLGNNTWISTTGIAPTTASQGALANGGGRTTTRVGTTTYAGGIGGLAFNTAANDFGGGGGGAGGNGGVGQDGFQGVDGGMGGAGGNATSWLADSTTLSGTGLVMLSDGTDAHAGWGGNGGDPSIGTTTGEVGAAFGGGGGGGSFVSSGALNYNGGAGGKGVIVLSWVPVAGPGSMLLMF